MAKAGGIRGPLRLLGEEQAAVARSRSVAQLDRGDESYTPIDRDRQVSQALQAYAAMTTSAARGAVRDVAQLRQ